jgi:hypothetical protein
MKLRNIILPAVHERRQKIQAKYKQRHDENLNASAATIRKGDFVLMHIPKKNALLAAKQLPFYVKNISRSRACKLHSVSTSTNPPTVLGPYSENSFMVKHLKRDTRYDPQPKAVDKCPILCPACDKKCQSMGGLRTRLDN